MSKCFFEFSRLNKIGSNAIKEIRFIGDFINTLKQSLDRFSMFALLKINERPVEPDFFIIRIKVAGFLVGADTRDDISDFIFSMSCGLPIFCVVVAKLDCFIKKMEGLIPLLLFL